MASTKRTRQGSSKRLQTIVVKDLQSLQNWSEDSTSGQQKYLIDDKDLLCDETLEDLEEVWASPIRKPQTKRRSQSASPHPKHRAGDEDVWATPMKGKRAKKAQTKRTSSQWTLPRSTLSPASPAALSTVPPNSPADLSPASQSTPNPYITFLIHSWETTSPLLLTHVAEVLSDVSSAPSHDSDSPSFFLQPLDDETNGPTLNPVNDVMNSLAVQTMDESGSPSILDIDSPILESELEAARPVQPSLQEEDEDNSGPLVPLVNLEDVLIFPDGTTEDAFLSDLPGPAQGAEDELAQLVPEDDDIMQRPQSSTVGDQSLFSGGALVRSRRRPRARPTDCQRDHVVPSFQIEE